MIRAALLLLLLLAAVNLALVHCSKSNSTAAKLKRCSACQIFVQELHNQMLTSSDTKETILKQDAMGYKLRVPYAGSTVQVNDILEKLCDTAWTDYMWVADSHLFEKRNSAVAYPSSSDGAALLKRECDSFVSAAEDAAPKAISTLKLATEASKSYLCEESLRFCKQGGIELEQTRVADLQAAREKAAAEKAAAEAAAKEAARVQELEAASAAIAAESLTPYSDKYSVHSGLSSSHFTALGMSDTDAEKVALMVTADLQAKAEAKAAAEAAAAAAAAAKAAAEAEAARVQELEAASAAIAAESLTPYSDKYSVHSGLSSSHFTALGMSDTDAEKVALMVTADLQAKAEAKAAAEAAAAAAAAVEAEAQASKVKASAEAAGDSEGPSAADAASTRTATAHESNPSSDADHSAAAGGSTGIVGGILDKISSFFSEHPEAPARDL